MGLDNSLVEDLLTDLPYISDRQIAKVRQTAKASNQSWHQIILETGLVSEADLLKSAASRLKIGWTSLPLSRLDMSLVSQIHQRVAEAYQMILFDINNRTKHIAMVNPTDLEALEFLQAHHPGPLKIYLTSQGAFLRVLDKYNTRIKPTAKLPKATETKIKSAAGSPLMKLLAQAVNQAASDIHIEPLSQHLQIRLRVDGLLKRVNKFPLHLAVGLTKELKTLSDIPLAPAVVAEHGRFELDINDQHCLFYVSLVPTLAGEKIAIKVTSQTAKLPTLSQLGFLGPNLKQVKDSLASASGLILFTGPNHAGKTTSLYSSLSLLAQGNLTIGTIEDPVKQRLEGINQLQVNRQTGMDFVSGIHALEQQDLDVMMIGSIRSSQVANLALQVASSGKLVLANLHAQDSLAGIRQLLDMDVPSYLLAANLRLVVGQRLVRRLSPRQLQAYQPTKSQLSQLKVDLKLTANNPWAEINQLAIELATDLDQTPSKDFSFYKSTNRSRTLGFKGSLNLNQVLSINPDVQATIAAGANRQQLEAVANKNGYQPLAVDGLAKARLGLTTIEEVLRVS